MDRIKFEIRRRQILRGMLRKSGIPPLLALGGLILLFFHRMAFNALILARGDTFLYFYPYWEAAARALQNGRIPHWNPDIFMGAPFLANSQVGFLYPLNWPLWLALPTPYAVNASILIHLFIAGWGTYIASRRLMQTGKPAALTTAVLFALGGYLSAQVEHVNQLQGLAWLPWLFVAAVSGNRSAPTRAALIAPLFGLQLLAGHTQTAFLSGAAIGVWLAASALFAAVKKEDTAVRLRRFIPLLGGALFALALTAVQLLPTLQLMRHSSRQGGLPPNEALSFSLHPALLGQTLLPFWRQAAFSEYSAFLPLTALALLIVGAWRWRRDTAVFSALALVIVGLLLALGAYNPVNWALAQIPPFNLFRVPARWLVFYAFGGALLAGRGLQLMLDGDAKEGKRPLQIALLLILPLIGWSLVGGVLGRLLPIPPEAPFTPPSRPTLLLWGGEGVLLLLWLREKLPAVFLPIPLLIVLFFGSRAHPYNNLTAPEAYFDLRPSTARLLAEQQDALYGERTLTLSNIFFDPGDQAESDAIYADQLSVAALYDYTIAVKQKEILSPNLPMVYQTPSVDGFDGGILPLRAYSEAMRLLLPNGETTTDGRLREQLTAVPDPRWLDLFNARYLITDKTGDRWVNGVFFDLQHPVAPQNGEAATVGWLPDYEASALWIIASAAPQSVEIGGANGEQWTLTLQAGGDGLYTAVFPQPTTVTAVAIAPPPDIEGFTVSGATLVDERDSSFLPLTLGNYRLIHSGDVKIYENLDALPRAFLVNGWEWAPDVETAVQRMAAPDFDWRETAVLIGEGDNYAGGQRGGGATVTAYAPEEIAVAAGTQAKRLLLLTEAFYPGWQATINGEPIPIYQANGMFQALLIPQGKHDIVFRYVPNQYRLGGAITVAALILLLIFVVWQKMKREN